MVHPKSERSEGLPWAQRRQINQDFKQLAAGLVLEPQITDGFDTQPRPLPSELEENAPVLGHIALNGDFKLK